jgi:Na+-translocating ferredoxin:NAD+ oxidoreductase RnfC subunit
MEFLTSATNRSSQECSWSSYVCPSLKRVSSIARGNTREYLHSSFLDRFQRCLEATKRSIVCTMDATHQALSTEFNVARLEGVIENLKALGGSDTKQMLESSVL